MRSPALLEHTQQRISLLAHTSQLRGKPKARVTVTAGSPDGCISQTCSEQGAHTRACAAQMPDPGRRVLNRISLHMVQAAPYPGRCGCAAPTTPAAFPMSALQPEPVRGQAGALRTLQRVSDI